MSIGIIGAGTRSGRQSRCVSPALTLRRGSAIAGGGESITSIVESPGRSIIGTTTASNTCGPERGTTSQRGSAASSHLMRPWPI